MNRDSAALAVSRPTAASAFTGQCTSSPLWSISLPHRQKATWPQRDAAPTPVEEHTSSASAVSSVALVTAVQPAPALVLTSIGLAPAVTKTAPPPVVEYIAQTVAVTNAIPITVVQRGASSDHKTVMVGFDMVGRDVAKSQSRLSGSRNVVAVHPPFSLPCPFMCLPLKGVEKKRTRIKRGE